MVAGQLRAPQRTEIVVHHGATVKPSHGLGVVSNAFVPRSGVATAGASPQPRLPGRIGERSESRDIQDDAPEHQSAGCWPTAAYAVAAVSLAQR